jgi:molecular chaperone DnaK (HSP70)
MGYSLGIDFGTSTTRVAIRKDDGDPFIVPIGPDETPEFIYSIASYKIGAGGVQTYRVGDQSHAGADIIIREVKRYLWAYESSYEQENRDEWNPDSKNFSLPAEKINAAWNPDTKKFLLGTVDISPERVVQDIIEKAIYLAVTAINDGKMTDKGIMATGTNEESIKKLPLRLGTAVVAGFQVRKKMAEIAHKIGFTDITISDDIIEEPVLASMSYLPTGQLEPGEIVLVYDFGGGTFDVAIVRVEDGSPVQWTLLAAEGERELGGANIDKELFYYVIDRLAEQEGMDTAEYTECLTSSESDRNDLDDLLGAVRVAKERLSGLDSTNILLDNFLGGKIDLELTRSELEKVVRGSKLLDRTFSCSLRAFKRAWALWTREFDDLDRSTDDLIGAAIKLGNTDLRDFIDKIILVGGSTRMPLINNEIRNRWGDHRVVSDTVVNPITAAAVGAAGNDVNIGGIIDRLPFTIWIKDESERLGTVLYEAFAPTSFHKVIGIQRSIELERFEFEIPSGANLWIYIRDPDDKLIAKVRVDTGYIGLHWMEIDYFGQILLKRKVPRQGDKELQQIVNPAQTIDQKERAELREQNIKQRKDADNSKYGKAVQGSPFLDPN